MFKPSRTYPALTLSLLCMAWLPSQAESFASSASSAGSASSGSVSDSIGDSSQSSSGDKKVAAGEYRITEVATVAERPGNVSRTMPGPVREFFLHLPCEAHCLEVFNTPKLIHYVARFTKVDLLQLVSDFVLHFLNQASDIHNVTVCVRHTLCIFALACEVSTHVDESQSCWFLSLQRQHNGT